MRIELKFAGEIPIMRLSGRFIAGGDGPFLRQKVTDLVEAGSRKIIIDFEDVPYLDSTGLGFLAGSQKVAQNAGATIVLAALNTHVMKVLESAQLMPFFVLADDEKSALEKLMTIPDNVTPEPSDLPPPAPAAPAPPKPSRGRKRTSSPESKAPENS